MKYDEVVELLRKRGYEEDFILEGYLVFREFGKLDFLYSDCTKKFDVIRTNDGTADVTMTQYWFETTTIKHINTFEELKSAI